MFDKLGTFIASKDVPGLEWNCDKKGGGGARIEVEVEFEWKYMLVYAAKGVFFL